MRTDALENKLHQTGFNYFLEQPLQESSVESVMQLLDKRKELIDKFKKEYENE